MVVIPAKAGIQSFYETWTPAFAGVTSFGTFYRSIEIVIQIIVESGFC